MLNSEFTPRRIPVLVGIAAVPPLRQTEPVTRKARTHRKFVMQQIVIQERRIRIRQVPAVAKSVKVPIQIRAAELQDVKTLLHAVPVNRHRQGEMQQVTRRVRCHKPAECAPLGAPHLRRDNVGVTPV